MMARLTDHLWQSIVFFGLAWALVRVTRRNPAALRLWLWRLAAFKFVLPFALLHALGGWLGFPVRHSAIPPPPVVSSLVSSGLAVAAPAQEHDLHPVGIAASLALMLAASAACLWTIRSRLIDEAARRSTEIDDQPGPPGFWQSAMLAMAALCTISLPLIAGATRDREWRQAMLAIDQERLRSAGIVITEASPRAGVLSRVDATHRGVEIHNVNLQDLVSLVYGIGKFEVFGGAMPWLEYPRYDVRVIGPVQAPEVFDPYALREPMTHYLYQQFGVSIRVNGTCQKPCKDYESFVIERLPRCTRLLGAHPSCG